MLKNIILSELKKRKESLSMPYEAIASKAGIGTATLKRAFAGNDISLSTLEKIATALECEITVKPKISAETAYKKQLAKKAEAIVGRIVQSSTLEEQTPSTGARAKILRETKKAISQMPKSKVWA